jgi:hypothetical protein
LRFAGADCFPTLSKLQKTNALIAAHPWVGWPIMLIAGSGFFSLAWLLRTSHLTVCCLARNPWVEWLWLAVSRLDFCANRLYKAAKLFVNSDKEWASRPLFCAFWGMASLYG